MSELKEAIRQHINSLDYYMKFENFTGKTLNEWMEPLLKSITEDGAISYLLDGESNERYRASPLASTLIWMCDIGLLPENAVDIMQRKLLFLRDNCEETDEDKGNIKKKKEDKDGWSMAEGVSVWSTSMALIALMNEVGLMKADNYKQSILWLVKQQKAGEKGWAYQLTANCKENVIMTALVLRVVAIALMNKDSFSFDENEERLLVLALNNGFQYIKDNIKYDKTKQEAYWCFGDKKHCAATVWVLLALKKMKQLNINKEIDDFYKNNFSKGIEFILDHMPKKFEKWEDEQIVCEAGAKYNKQKNYYSFSPTLLLELFEIGISPFHPKVISQIKWLIHNEDKWKIEQYDRVQRCSFTYAMVISAIAKWAVLVGQDNSKRLLNDPESRIEALTQKIIGMPVFRDSCVQIVRVSRIRSCWIASLIILALLFKSEYFYRQIVVMVSYIWETFSGSQNTIFINVISSAIYAALLCLGGSLFKVIGIIRRIK